MKENGDKFASSCPADALCTDADRGQPKRVVSTSSGFETLTSCGDEHTSLSSSSLYQTMSREEDNQNVAVSSTFRPQILHGSQTSQFHESAIKTHPSENTTDNKTPWEKLSSNSCERGTRSEESRHLREPLLSKTFKTLDNFSCHSCRAQMQLTPVNATSQATASLSRTRSPTKTPSENFKGCISGDLSAGCTESQFRIRLFPLPLKPECKDSSDQTSFECEVPENEDIHIFAQFPCGKLTLTTP